MGPIQRIVLLLTRETDPDLPVVLSEQNMSNENTNENESTTTTATNPDIPVVLPEQNMEPRRDE